jgi:hypothetical protein
MHATDVYELLRSDVNSNHISRSRLYVEAERANDMVALRLYSSHLDASGTV